jgi:hypothetical protein
MRTPRYRKQSRYCQTMKKSSLLAIVIFVSGSVSFVAFGQDDAHLSQEQIDRIHEALQRLSFGSHFITPKKTEWPPEGLTGKIISVQDDLVEVSVGSDDGLSPGHRLRVVRNGREIAILQVVTTDYDTARAKLLGPGHSALRAGDSIEAISKPPTPDATHEGKSLTFAKVARAESVLFRLRCRLRRGTRGHR